MHITASGIRDSELIICGIIIQTSIVWLLYMFECASTFENVHGFLSTWGAISLKKPKFEKIKLKKGEEQSHKEVLSLGHATSYLTVYYHVHLQNKNNGYHFLTGSKCVLHHG